MAVIIEPKVHLWTRREYARMAEAGLFDNRRVELIEGEVIDMSPKGSPHSTAVHLTQKALQAIFVTGYYIRIQDSLVFGSYSEPEPDVAVVSGDIRDYTTAHPTSAVLVVEVAETSLRYDRKVKGSLYAKVGIPEYWIINLAARQVEVYHDPQPDAAQRFGFGYAQAHTYDINASLAPLALPNAMLAVADLLP